MFLRKNVYGLNQDKDSEQSGVRQPDTLTTNKQNTFTLANTASELLEFRLFAIKHGHTYLSRIIEPVVKETLNIAHQLDQRFKTNDLSDGNSFSNQQNPDFALSREELECLKWCSLGKSYNEVARETNQQESAVMLQMKSARQKLKTDTDAHSVATVIRLKII